MIYSLHVYRGFAALLIVFYHAYIFMADYSKQNKISELFSGGYVAVQFFFVLSGFVIYYIHKNDIGVTRKFRIFIEKRFIRIYPIYWLATFMHLPFILFLNYNHDGPAIKVLPLINSLMLIPQRGLHIQVAWTLVYEIIFYLFFALLIRFKKVGSIVFLIWQLAIVILNIYPQKILYEYGALFSLYNLLFALGLIAGYLSLKFEKIVSKNGFWIFVIGNLIFLTALFGRRLGLSNTFNINILLFGFASFLIVLGSRSSTIQSLFNIKSIFFLGDASYSIFLMHQLVIFLMGTMLIALNIFQIIPVTVIFILIIFISVSSGIMFHKFIEIPVHLWLKQKIAVSH